MGTILVIDDEDSIRHLLKDVLEKAKHRVLEARDGREGLTLYQNNKVDLVLMDILMPGTDGLEATLQLTREYLDAKIIAMFRNPVDLVYSFHSQLLYWSEETEKNFETAWRLQERRRIGLDVPKTSRDPFWLQYRDVGSLGTQTQRLLSVYPRNQVKLILFDDFAASPQRVYDEVIDFLGIVHDQRTEFPRVNENKRARLSFLRNFYRKPPPVLRQMYRVLKRTSAGKHVAGFKQRVVALNTAREQRSPLSPAFREELVDTFRGEVALLSRILDRDLSHWT